MRHRCPPTGQQHSIRSGIGCEQLQGRLRSERVWGYQFLRNRDADGRACPQPDLLGHDQHFVQWFPRGLFFDGDCGRLWRIGVAHRECFFPGHKLWEQSVGNRSAGIKYSWAGWLVSQTPAASSNPTSEVTGDFNGDGIPDLALLGTSNTYAPPFSIAILFGKGDGTSPPVQRHRRQDRHKLCT